jgi:hypothetical protein
LASVGGQQLPIGLRVLGRNGSRSFPALRSRDPTADVGERFRKARRARCGVVDLLAIKTEASGMKLHLFSVNGREGV